MGSFKFKKSTLSCKQRFARNAASFTVPCSILAPELRLGCPFEDTCSMTQDALVARILTEVKLIALVGWSPKPDRPSHRVAAYLAGRGYRIIPVNPGQAGVLTPWGEVVRAALSDIAEPVDMIDIFRAPAEVGPVVEEAIARLSGRRAIWMQLGVINEAAAQTAAEAGLEVVMDRCPAIEIPRLGL